LTGPSTEHLAVRRNKHEWIERQRQVRCGQVAPRPRCTLPYLRFDIDTRIHIDPATNHEHVAVRQRGVRRVPSTVIHIGQPRPDIIQGIIPESDAEPDPVVLVPSGYEELSITQKGMA
jgi:hypothetical protein